MNHTSLWNELVKLDSYPQLEGDAQTDVLIIGGGLTGLLCGYLLGQNHIDYMVVEAENICGGVTSSTTGKITAQHSLIYNKLISTVGVEKARQYLNANLNAFQNYKRIICENQINCSFEETPNVVYTLENPMAIENEIVALNKIGISAELITSSSLPFDIRCGLKTFYSAHFNPLEFAAAIAKDMKIYEHTRVCNVDDMKAVTDRGTITAKKIIFACHFPQKNFPGMYFARMSQDRSYLAAVKHASKMDAMYVDENTVGMTFRNYENYLILGGFDHRTGEGDGLRFQSLEEKIKTLYPRSEVMNIWSTQDCMPADSIPFIGRYSSLTPDIYIASGYGKWGMSTSMAAAMIITDEIMGKENENAKVFSPKRLNIKGAYHNSMQNMKTYITGLSAEMFQKSKLSLQDVKKGEAKIVEINRKKAGVYCDDAGKYHIVNARCSHLGCLLSFNADEKSWDCPCHGSRYDVDGNIISNPAGTDIKIIT